MKTTINKKVYDTNKAALVAKVEDTNADEYSIWQEKLYLTSKGNWFLHGWGEKYTVYAKDCGSYLTEGERIIVMTAEEALDWCEKNLLQNVIDQHFSDMVENA